MQPLQKGQQYVVKAGGGQLFCRNDFEKEIFLMQQSVGSPQQGTTPIHLIIGRWIYVKDKGLKCQTFIQLILLQISLDLKYLLISLTVEYIFSFRLS